MAPHCLIIRCMAVRQGDQWVAMTLELGLAAQDDTFEAAKARLEAQIKSYVREALTEDKEFADQLLSRKAHWSVYARYHMLQAKARIHLLAQDMGRLFMEPLPLIPA